MSDARSKFRLVVVALFVAACGDTTATLDEGAQEASSGLPCDSACVDGEQCFFTQCVREPVSCEPLFVTCRATPPVCPPGQTPSVQDLCWGECVDLSRCDWLVNCDLCRAHDLLCLHHFRPTTDDFPDRWCVERPPEITCTEQTCECLGSLCGYLPCLEVVGDEVVCGTALETPAQRTRE